MTVVALILIGLFVLIAMPALFEKNRYLKAISSDENNYCFKYFGLFWGVSTTLFVTTFVVFYIDLQQLIRVYNHLGLFMQGIWIFCIISIFILTSYATICIALKPQFKLTVPHLYLHLATFCCRGSESTARKVVAFLVIWFDMLGLQLLCHNGVVAILAFPAAPLAIVSSALLIAVVGAFVIYIFACLYTIGIKLTNLHGASERRENPPAVSGRIVDDSWRYLPYAGIPIPLLMALALFLLLLAFLGRYVNSAAVQYNLLSFIWSIVIPLILGVASMGLNWWLENEDGRQEQTMEELPHQQLVEELPQEKVVAGSPQEQAVEELPQEQVVAGSPQEQAVEELPQEQVVEGLPQEQVVAGSPQEQAVEELPQDQVVAGSPQQQAVEELPQEQVAEELPQEQVAEGLPQEQVAEGLP